MIGTAPKLTMIPAWVHACFLKMLGSFIIVIIYYHPCVLREYSLFGGYSLLGGILLQHPCSSQLKASQKAEQTETNIPVPPF